MEPSHDVWSPFASLLADLIEKYASELDLEKLPDPNEATSQEQSTGPRKNRTEL